MTTKEFYVVAFLIEVEVEIIAALGALNRPKNTLGSWVIVGSLRRVPFCKACTFSHVTRLIIVSGPCLGEASMGQFVPYLRKNRRPLSWWAASDVTSTMIVFSQ